MADNNLWVRQAREKLAFVGIMLFAGGIWLSWPMFTGASDLIPISGKLDTAYLNIATVASTNVGKGISYTSHSQKATLTFRIKGYEQIYSIKKNIGDRSDDENYNQVLRGLKEANLVSVWIKKKDSLETNPDVWQVYSDKTPLMTLKAVKEKDLPVVIFLFILGALCLALIFWTKKAARRRLLQKDGVS